mmetsp:Transcript_31084/g.65589  ORF Transcript_31084/g.65589 Transcript_31084/m.65589 type:complete len:244 (+) Transcript_31084:1157-1888(+)
MIRRLVKQQYVRLLHQRRAEGHPLPLPTAQFRKGHLAQVVQTKPGRDLVGLGQDGPAISRVHFGRGGGEFVLVVFEGGHRVAVSSHGSIYRLARPSCIIGRRRHDAQERVADRNVRRHWRLLFDERNTYIARALDGAGEADAFLAGKRCRVQIGAARLGQDFHQTAFSASVAADEANFGISGEYIVHIAKLEDCTPIVTAGEAIEGESGWEARGNGNGQLLFVVHVLVLVLLFFFVRLLFLCM